MNPDIIARCATARLARTGWEVSEIGYGMWGMAGWTGSDDEESRQSLDRAVELGCNFFDTAWAYGDGHSEQLLGELLKRHPGKRLYTATKIPPKNRKWPARPEYPLDDVFPADYIREYTEKSLREHRRLDRSISSSSTSGTTRGPTDVRWQRAVGALKEDGLVSAIGISINRWQPANVLRGARDRISSTRSRSSTTSSTRARRTSSSPSASEQDIAVIARVPFDEGSLTGTLTADIDLAGRGLPQHLLPAREPDATRSSGSTSCGRSSRAGMTMPELALRHILQHPAVSTVIPGMRKLRHVEAEPGGERRRRRCRRRSWLS